MQTNNGGRGQSVAVAVKLRVFQVAGLPKIGSPSQKIFRFFNFGFPNFLCLLELSIASGEFFAFYFQREKIPQIFEIKFLSMLKARMTRVRSVRGRLTYS